MIRRDGLGRPIESQLRCPCGRPGAWAFVAIYRWIDIDRRVCCMPQCGYRADVEAGMVRLVRAGAGHAELRPVDWRAPHRTEPLQPPRAA